MKPLTDSTNLTWTRSRLEKERNDWWDTQVTGSQEVWGAIWLAAQSLQAGKLKDAQQWLETMECTCPTGCLWKGVYDSTGIMYKVPEWLIVEPEGLVAEADSDEDAAMGAAEVAQESDDEEDDEPSLVRVRISRNGHDVALKIRRKEQIMSIVEKLKKQAKVRSSTSGPVQHEGAVGLGYCFQVPTQPPLTHRHCPRDLANFWTAGPVLQDPSRLWRARLPRPRDPRIPSLLGLCKQLHRERASTRLISPSYPLGSLYIDMCRRMDFLGPSLSVAICTTFSFPLLVAAG